MPGNGSFSVTISAVDKASAYLDGINKRIKAMSAPVDRARKSFDQLAESTGIKAVGREFTNLARSSERFFVNIGRSLPLASSLAGALSAAGAAELVKSYASIGSNLYLTAKQAGATVPQLQRLGNAASLAGGNSEGAASSLVELNKNMQLFAHGGQASPDFVAGMAALHVNLRNSNGQMRSSSSVMDELLHKLAAMKNSQQQIYFGNKLLGSSFSSLWPVISQGTAALDHYLQTGQSMVTVSDAQAKHALIVQGQMRRLGTDIQNTALAIADQFAPAAGGAAESVAKWLEQNQQLIATDVAGWLKTIGTDANDVAQAFGGWKPLLEGIFTLMAARFAIGFLTPFGRAAFAIGRVTKALVAMTAAEREAVALGGKTAAGAAGSARGGLLGLLSQGLFGADVIGRYLHGGTFDQGGLGRLITPEMRRQFPGLGNAAPQTRTFDTRMTPQARGLLDTIAGTESPGYNVEYGGTRFSSYAHHPNAPHTITGGPNAGLMSTAAGRYQFTYGTWEEAKQALHLRDFSPASQDKAAWWLAQRDYYSRTGRDLATDLNSKNPATLARIGQALSGTWTSLPGGIESRAGSRSFVGRLASNTAAEGQDAAYQQALTARLAQLRGANGGTASLSGTGGSDGTTTHVVKGRAQVTVRLQGAPPGTQVSSIADGDLFTGAPRVEMPMPAGGGPQ